VPIEQVVSIFAKTLVRALVKAVFKFLSWLLVFTALASLFCYIRFSFLAPGQRSHLRNFSVRVLDSSLSAFSKTRLGFFYEGIVGTVLAAFLVLVLLRALSPNDDWASHAKSTLLALLVGVLIPFSILASAVLWKTVTAVYDEHNDNVERLQATVNERNYLKDELGKRDIYIRELEARERLSCPPNVSSPLPQVQTHK
jgi:hypothetical protein